MFMLDVVFIAVPFFWLFSVFFLYAFNNGWASFWNLKPALLLSERFTPDTYSPNEIFFHPAEARAEVLPQTG
jgi:hypothetical protein